MTASTSSDETTSGEIGIPALRPAHASLAALCLVARLHHVAAEPAHLAHRLGWPPSHEPDVDDILLAARHIGLSAKRSRSTADRLSHVPLPALVVLAEGIGTARTERIVVLAQCDGQRVLFMDPRVDPREAATGQATRPTIEPLDVFAQQWTGDLILVTSRASLAGELARFDFSWFVPSLVKYRRLLGEVLLVSLFLQLFALVSPLSLAIV